MGYGVFYSLPLSIRNIDFESGNGCDGGAVAIGDGGLCGARRDRHHATSPCAIQLWLSYQTVIHCQGLGVSFKMGMSLGGARSVVAGSIEVGAALHRQEWLPYTSMRLVAATAGGSAAQAAQIDQDCDDQEDQVEA